MHAKFGACMTIWKIVSFICRTKWPTNSSLAYCATLGGGFDRDQLLITTRSSITLSSDRGKPYL